MDADPSQIARQIAANVPAGLARLRTPDLAWMLANRHRINRKLGVIRRLKGCGFAAMTCGMLITLPLLHLLVAGLLNKAGVPADVAGGIGGGAVIVYIILLVIAGARRSKQQANLLVIEQSTLSLGYLVSSDHTLRDPGNNADWAVVLTTEDPQLLSQPERMLELAVRAGLAKRDGQPNAEWFRAAKWLENPDVVDARGNLRSRVPLPRTLSGNDCTWMMSVFVNRDDIPGGYFHESTWLVPLLLVRPPTGDRERQEQIAAVVTEGGAIKGAIAMAKLALSEVEKAGRGNEPVLPERVELVPIPFWNGEMFKQASE